MNRPTQAPDPASDEQASLWAARLEGGPLTDADRSELEGWLAGDPSRRQLLSGYCRLSARLDRMVPALAASGSVELPPARPAAGAGSWSPWKAAAAGLAAAALAVGAFWYGHGAGRTEDLSTRAGQRGSFTLSDGTRVELNANTTITVQDGRSERRVHLANGEAFFVVSKDKSRPFVVDTPAGSVRVTGTIFNVLTEAASQLDVTVVEGSVQVRPGGPGPAQAAGPTSLEAGGVLKAEDGSLSVTTLPPADIDDMLAWRRGQIVCKAMPVSEALARFSHYYGRVMTATPEAGSRRASGQYSLGNLDEFLDFLHQSMSLNVARSADGSVRVSLPGEP
jgi:transmembrane sensor